ncbi:uncharacterized protein [Ambystoma mexicanum]|uniref:uncharacterized protein n=1 Tax=Ambystoma mexicanum TaxID=8296 RepID=UPI0037E8A991
MVVDGGRAGGLWLVEESKGCPGRCAEAPSQLVAEMRGRQLGCPWAAGSSTDRLGEPQSLNLDVLTRWRQKVYGCCSRGQNGCLALADAREAPSCYPITQTKALPKLHQPRKEPDSGQSKAVTQSAAAFSKCTAPLGTPARRARYEKGAYCCMWCFRKDRCSTISADVLGAPTEMNLMLWCFLLTRNVKNDLKVLLMGVQVNLHVANSRWIFHFFN